MKNFKFEVTLEEGDLIVKSLSKQPFELVAVLIGKLQKQALDQSQQEPIKDAGGES